MNAIRTIYDLQNASPKEVAEVRSAVQVKTALLRSWTELGKKTGMTREEYEHRSKNREIRTCPTCEGEGHVREKMRSVGVIHSSSAHRCRTRIYYDVTGEYAPYEEIPYDLQITFAFGHVVHRQIQDALGAEYGDAFADEVPVNLPEALIFDGAADFTLDLGFTRVLGEIKTIAEDGFMGLKKPKQEDHLLQASLYAKALDHPFICFLYVSKGKENPIKEYVVPYDEMVYQKWYWDKLLPVDQALERGKPPPADATEYECKKCNYNQTCPQRIVRRDRLRA